MSELVFCRSCNLDLVLCSGRSDARSVKIKDHCQFVIGIKGQVDQESGMILNLVEIDSLLKKFLKKFKNREVKNIFSFIQVIRNYFRDVFNAQKIFHAEVDFLSLTTHLGRMEWRAPWSEYDILFVKADKKLFKIKNNRYEVKKIRILQRGLKINPYVEHPKKISGYAIFDSNLKVWKYTELSRQEFGIKTLRK